LRFFRAGMYGLVNRKKREILILGLAKDEILQAVVVPRKVIGCMRTQDSADGKREFSAEAWSLCEGLVFLFTGVPWCERFLWF
jgi:hypothetical protein